MDWNSVLATLLGMGIKALMSLIPWLAGFTTGPLGWLVGIAISWLSKKLADWIVLEAKLKKIQITVQSEVADLTSATDNLSKVQNDPNATKEQHEKALETVYATFDKLRDFRVQQRRDKR